MIFPSVQPLFTSFGVIVDFVKRKIVIGNITDAWAVDIDLSAGVTHTFICSCSYMYDVKM
jgi:hypothetical protein